MQILLSHATRNLVVGDQDQRRLLCGCFPDGTLDEENGMTALLPGMPSLGRVHVIRFILTLLRSLTDVGMETNQTD